MSPSLQPWFSQLTGLTLPTALFLVSCWIFNFLVPFCTPRRGVVTMKEKIKKALAWATTSTLATFSGGLAVAG